MSRRRGRVRPRAVPYKFMDPIAGSNIEVAVGSLLLVVLGLVGMIWGAAVLSSLVVMGERADVTVADAAVAGVRMGSEGMAWDGAWPPEIESALPGARWFWFFFALEIVAVALLFWPAWRLLGPRVGDPLSVVIEPNPPNHPRAARRLAEQEAADERRAARRAAASGGPGGGPATGGGGPGAGGGPGGPPPTPASTKIVVDKPGGGRLVLGRVGSNLVAVDGLHSVLALGPTGSGKTSGLAIPALLEWEGPAVVLATKSDLITLAFEQRAERGGRTWLYDPLATMADASTDTKRSFRGDSWSPLHRLTSEPQARNEPELDRRIRQWSRARRSAGWMVAGTRRPDGDLPGAAYAAAEQMLGPLLLAAAAEELPVTKVVEWVDRRDDAGVRSALERTGVTEAQASWESAHRFDAATTTAAYQVLTSALFALGDPVVAAQAQDPTISATDLLDGKANTLFVLADAGGDGRLRPLTTTLVSEVVEAAMNRAAVSSTGRLPAPLLVLIDDAAGAVTADLVDRLAAMGAGRGIQLLTLIQDLSHLGRDVGPDRAREAADSHRARVVLPGITDPATLDYLNMIIVGNRLIDPDLPSELRAGLADGEQPVVWSSASWMRTIDDGSAVLIHGNLAPIRMRLRPWYRESALHDRLVPRPEATGRLERLTRPFRRGADVPGLLRGHPSPFDSAANDREAQRYWDAIKDGGQLPDALEFRDGSEDRPGS